MQSVRVVTERLASISGVNLIRWTAEKYGASVSYTEAISANKFNVTVDGGGENSIFL